MKLDNLSKNLDPKSLHDWELIEAINEYHKGYNQDDFYWKLKLEEERRNLPAVSHSKL